MQQLRFIPALIATLVVATACAPTAATPSPTAAPVATTPAAQASPTTRPYPWTDSGFKAGDVISIIGAGSPGGGIDLNARMIAPFVESNLRLVTGVKDLQVSVLAVPGAGQKTGMDRMANSKPDGLTLGMVTPSVPVALQVQGASKYDMANWTWMTNFSIAHKAVLVRKDLVLPKPGFAGLIERSKQKPILLASSGSLSDWRVIQAMLKDNGLTLASDLVLLPGPAEQAAALLRKEIEAAYGNQSALATVVAANPELTVLTSTACARDPQFPTIPVLGEEQIPGKEDICTVIDPSYRMFAGPAGIPAPTAAALREAFRLATADPAFKEQSAKAGFPVEYIGPEATRAIIVKMLDQFQKYKSILLQQ